MHRFTEGLNKLKLNEQWVQVYNEAFARSYGFKALNWLKAINKNAHNRMTYLSQPTPDAQRESGKWLHRRDDQRLAIVPKARAKKSQGAAESLELAPASLCLLFPVFRGMFRRLISQANRLC